MSDINRDKSVGSPAQQRQLRTRVIQVAYGDSETVEERIRRVYELVVEQHDADFVVLPELWAHGGFASPRWAERAESLDGPFMEAMSEAAKVAGVLLHAGSLVEKSPGGSGGALPYRGLSNTSAVFDKTGRVQALYRKIHRFGFGEGEPLLMDAGTEVVTTPITRDGETLGTVGLATCYDLRFPELFRALLDKGSEMFVVPAAWPKPRVDHWLALGRARAIENQCYVVQCNSAGTHSGVEMGGRSQIVSPQGEVLAEAGDAAGDVVLDVLIDLEEVGRQRRDFPVLEDRLFWKDGGEIRPRASVLSEG